MRTRAIIGVLCLLTGTIWMLQGIGVARGSPMTGRSQWTVIGTAVIVVGVALLVWANRLRHRARSRGR